jgi:mono/diheme cytochrome c family protein
LFLSPEMSMVRRPPVMSQDEMRYRGKAANAKCPRSMARGKSVYAENCEACHGPDGRGGIKDRLVGGQGSLATDNPIKTVGSYWPYATTLFDYIHGRCLTRRQARSASTTPMR